MYADEDGEEIVCIPAGGLRVTGGARNSLCAARRASKRFLLSSMVSLRDLISCGFDPKRVILSFGELSEMTSDNGRELSKGGFWRPGFGAMSNFWFSGGISWRDGEEEMARERSWKVAEEGSVMLWGEPWWCTVRVIVSSCWSILKSMNMCRVCSMYRDGIFAGRRNGEGRLHY